MMFLNNLILKSIEVVKKKVLDGLVDLFHVVKKSSKLKKNSAWY